MVFVKILLFTEACDDISEYEDNWKWCLWRLNSVLITVIELYWSIYVAGVWCENTVVRDGICKDWYVWWRRDDEINSTYCEIDP